MYSDLGNVSQLFELQSKLKEKKHGDSTVIDYYNTLIGLWQELDLFDDNTGACPDCSIKYTKKLEKERLFAFLHGLNKDLDEVYGRNLGTKPLPGIQDITEVRREESRKRVMLKTSKDPSESFLQNSALVTKRSSSASREQRPNYGEQRPNSGEQRLTPDQRGGRQNNRVWCDHCQRSNHS